MKIDYYLILGVSEKAGLLEIRAAYKKMAFKHHPDRNIGDKESEKSIVLINDAKRIFEDPLLRKDYDLKLKEFKNRDLGDETFGVGVEAANAGDYEKAVSCFTEAIRINGGDAKSYFNRAQAFFMLENYPLAIEDYEVVISLDPKNIKARMMNGVALKRLGKLTQALTILSEAVEISKNDPALYYNRGQVFLTMSDFDDAIIDFYKVLKIDPQFPGAKEQFENAKMLVRKTLKSRKNSPAQKLKSSDNFLYWFIVVVLIATILVWL